MRLTFMIAIVLSAIVSVFGQVPQRFSGKLMPRLSPDMVHVYQRVYSAAKTADTYRFETPPEKGSVISVGDLIDQRNSGSKTIMLLIEPPAGAPYVWVDRNGNGIYETAERHELSASSEDLNVYIATIRLPIKYDLFHDYPIFIAYFRGFRHPKLAATDRLIEQSVYALAYGRVQVGPRQVLFQYPFAPHLPALSTTEGLFGVDVDGDGRILDQQFSVETASAMNDEPVFPLGDKYVSTTAIDMTTGTITVRQREKSEYTRIDLAVGREMPDFEFTDLYGKQRKLSDFRGKYLLVDFWGVWCGDCTRETPFHLAAYERFKKRGFDILGVDADDTIETVKGYITKNKIAWTQATHASTKQLREKRYRLQEYPSTVLLGPDGKVLVLDQHQLQGEALLKTLDSLLPKH